VFIVFLAVAVAVNLALLLGGIVLIVCGDRSRVVGSSCLCGYDLRGIHPASEVCPECGGSLDQLPRRRSDRGMAMTTSGVIALVAFAVTAFVSLYLLGALMI